MTDSNGVVDDAEKFAAWPYFQDRFDRTQRSLRFKGGDAVDVPVWQEMAREKLSALIGLNEMQPCPLEATVTDRVDCGDYIRERVEIQAEPMITMPVYVLVPKGNGPFPTMLAPHGHGFGGKEGTAGVEDAEHVREAIQRSSCDYGRQLVQAGFTVLCPDARGFGERQERDARHDPMGWSCYNLANMAVPLGQTVIGMFVWDLMRLIDYAETRPECDTTRLGCTGLSGGGMQTLWTAALDTRISAALTSGYFYGVKESLLNYSGNCSCNYVPHLWLHADQGDLGALIAPRPFMVQTGDKDTLNGASGVQNVTGQLAITREVYRTLVAEDRLHHDLFDGEHRWDSTHSIDFFIRYLQNEATAPRGA